MKQLHTLCGIAVMSTVLVFAPPARGQQPSVKETEQMDFAQGLLARGMYDMATAEYQKFIVAFPQSPYIEEANLAVGESLFLAQKTPDALAALNAFKQAYPASPRMSTVLLRLGQVYIQQKQYDAALKELTSIDPAARLTGPELQSFYFYTGKAYRGRGDLSPALVYFQKAFETSDAHAHTPYAYQEFAEIRVEADQYKEGIEAYTKAAQSVDEESLKGYFAYKVAETMFLSGDYAGAIDGFHQVLARYPGLDIAHGALANLLLAHLNSAQYDQVLAEYAANAALIKDDAGSFSPHFTAARAYIKLNKYDEATALLNKILSFAGLKDEDRRKALVKKADIAIGRKQYQEAVAILEGGLPTGAEAADEAVFLTARAYYGLGDLARSGELFAHVKDTYPDSSYVPAAILGMAHALQGTGRYAEAADFFMKYYHTDGEEVLRADALYDAAMMARKLELDKDAMSRAEEYLKVFPSGERHEDIVLLLGDLYAKNERAEDAVGLLQQYLTDLQKVKRPDAVYFLLGFNQQRAGREEQALEAYAKVSLNKEDPKFYASALKNSAAIYMKRKDWPQAAQSFDRVVQEIDANYLDLKTYLWLCDQYLRGMKFNDLLRISRKAQVSFAEQGQFELAYFEAEALRGLKDADHALKAYDIVLASPDKNMYTGGARIGKGLLLIDQGRLDEARAEFQKALEETPEDHTVTLRARFETANIAVLQKNTDEAVKFYLLVATIYEDDEYCPESLLRAGGILENLGRFDEARKGYEEILEKYKDSPSATQAKERIAALRERKN